MHKVVDGQPLYAYNKTIKIDYEGMLKMVALAVDNTKINPVIIRSAAQALGLKVDKMRGIWNRMPSQDRRFVARFSNVVEVVQDAETQKLNFAPTDKSWDELTDSQKNGIRINFERMMRWMETYR